MEECRKLRTRTETPTKEGGVRMVRRRVMESCVSTMVPSTKEGSHVDSSAEEVPFSSSPRFYFLVGLCFIDVNSLKDGGKL